MNINVIIIIGYLLLMIGCGIYSTRFTKNRDDYLISGRRLPLWVFFPTLAAVILGGGSTFGSASQAYQYGLSGGWITISFGAGIVAVGFIMAARISNLRVYTISEMLEKRYAHGTRYVSAIISVVYTAMISVVQIVALGTILKTLTGWDLNTCIVIGGSVALIYTLLGGMIAVTITDFIQFVLMTIGITILLIFGVDQAGGMQSVVSKVPENFFSLTNIGFDKMLTYFFLFFLGIMIGQDIWLRLFTAKNKKVASTGSILAGIYSIGWGLAMGLAGILAYILLPGLDSPQESLPSLALEILPIGISGLVLAALISALMSTMDSTLLASASLITNDCLRPFCDWDDQKEILVYRIVTIIVGIIVIGLAVAIGNVFVALDIAYAYLSGCIFVPVVAALFWKKATWQGAVISMLVSGLVVTFALYNYGVSDLKPIIFGLIVSAVLMIIISLMIGGPKEKDLEQWNTTVD